MKRILLAFVLGLVFLLQGCVAYPAYGYGYNNYGGGYAYGPYYGYNYGYRPYGYGGYVYRPPSFGFRWGRGYDGHGWRGGGWRSGGGGGHGWGGHHR